MLYACRIVLLIIVCEVWRTTTIMTVCNLHMPQMRILRGQFKKTNNRWHFPFQRYWNRNQISKWDVQNIVEWSRVLKQIEQKIVYPYKSSTEHFIYNTKPKRTSLSSEFPVSRNMAVDLSSFKIIIPINKKLWFPNILVVTPYKDLCSLKF